MSIVHPFWFCNRLITVTSLVFPIIYGLILGSAPLFGWGKYGRSRPNSTYCAYDFKEKTHNDESFFYTCIVLTFGIPLIVTAICFAHIIVILHRTAYVFARKFGRSSSLSRDSRKSVHDNCISSLCTGLIYFASWVPYACVCFYFFYEEEVSLNFELLSIYLSKSSTISSPVVFCLVEKRVRKFIRREPSVMSLAMNALNHVSLGQFEQKSKHCDDTHHVTRTSIT